MNRWLVVSLIVAFVASLWACGKREVKVPDPQTEADLTACRDKVKDQDELRSLLEKEIADLKLGSTTGEEVVVTIEGDVVSIKAGKGKGPHRGEPRGNAKDQALYERFVASVKKSRGAIKKCYQNALKKDSKLQARTVSLKIQVNYKTSGKMSSATFNPRISANFDKCMSNVAKRWTLPAAPRRVAFHTKMMLTPE